MNYHISALDIGVSKKNPSYHMIEILNPLCASDIVILNSSFGYKRDAAGDATFSGYYNMSPPTVNLNLNGSDFSGW